MPKISGVRVADDIIGILDRRRIYVARFAGSCFVGARDPTAGAVGYGYIVGFADWLLLRGLNYSWGLRHLELAL